MMIKAQYNGKLTARREQRIEDVLRRFDAFKSVRSGQFLANGSELLFTNVEWNQSEDGTDLTFPIEDAKAERIASELRACGLVVTASAEEA